jgi:molybdopterin-guanine dinucleotide biosynthesis protein A
MGRPKCWLPFGDETLLQRVVRVLSGVGSPVVVVAAPGQDVPPLPSGVAVVRDDLEGKGPLAGLVAGLAAVAGHAGLAYVSSCDVPFLKPAFVARVVEALGAAPDLAAAPRVGGFTHPLAAAYRTAILPVARAMLAADELRLTDLLARVPTRFLDAAELAGADPDLVSLRNVNTPEQYATALESLC